MKKIVRAASGKFRNIAIEEDQNFVSKPIPQFREACDWQAERPFITLFRGERFGDFVKLFNAWIEGKLDVVHILQQLPPQVEFLRSDIPNMYRCRNREDVLLIIGQCPKQDASKQLEQPLSNLPFTSVMYRMIEHVTGRLVLPLNICSVSSRAALLYCH